MGWRAHIGVDDRVLPAQEEHGSLGIACIRDLLVPQAVRRPVEVALEEVGYTKFCTDEVLDDEVQTLFE